MADVIGKLKHVVMVGHLVTAHGDKQPQHVGRIGTKSQRLALLRDVSIGCHVLLQLLALKRNGQNYVAVVLTYIGGLPAFPQPLVAL